VQHKVLYGMNLGKNLHLYRPDASDVIGNVNIATYSNIRAIIALLWSIYTSIAITNGASDNYILKSDATGNASWASTISLGGYILDHGSSGSRTLPVLMDHQGSNVVIKWIIRDQGTPYRC
jgi:hypothetical protein